MSRLTDASGSYGVINYEYDAVGNRKSREQNNRLEAYEYAESSNRLLNVITEGEQGELHERVLGYDAVGNIVNDSASAATKALTFGHNNRLEQVKVSGSATVVAGYEYNAKGQRVIKQVDGNIIHFHYDTDNRLIAETTVTGAPIREYIYAANQRIAMVDYQSNTNGEIFFMVNDHLGAPQLLVDAAQQVVWSVNQSPFGEVTVNGNVEQPLRFPGQYADSETGYSYNYFRDYDPTLGRYIESDPIGLEAGVNTFGYVSGNPITSFDLLGLIGEMCTTHDHLSYNTSNGEGWYDTKSGNTFGPSPNWGMDDGIEGFYPEQALGGIGLWRAGVSQGYKIIGALTARSTPSYNTFAIGSNARDLFKILNFSPRLISSPRSFFRPDYYWAKSGGDFYKAAASLGRSNTAWDSYLIPTAPLGVIGLGNQLFDE
ncbi:hypothetical protein D0C16_04695 [Cellvibrio sp. KY-GH-1]|uniref:RHS repeat domain-containing protein n=1 Tax=Cellvibrio sp. KY-GH-1 TaxID=2303332 RepID=UPI001245A8DD|nr:RHS repeat-associated core domain-containing protein [Cellvibrio sp. KY-GH-1]QEY15334.1 hypothetical protein D0C16_04695 [Cellvibrio sp. KY-GH-1]